MQFSFPILYCILKIEILYCTTTTLPSRYIQFQTKTALQNITKITPNHNIKQNIKHYKNVVTIVSFYSPFLTELRQMDLAIQYQTSHVIYNVKWPELNILAWSWQNTTVYNKRNHVKCWIRHCDSPWPVCQWGQTGTWRSVHEWRVRPLGWGHQEVPAHGATAPRPRQAATLALHRQTSQTAALTTSRPQVCLWVQQRHIRSA